VSTSGSSLALLEGDVPVIAFVFGGVSDAGELTIARKSDEGWSFRRIDLGQFAGCAASPRVVDLAIAKGKLRVLVHGASVQSSGGGCLVEDAAGEVSVGSVPCGRVFTGATSDLLGFFHLVGFDGRKFLYCHETSEAWDVEKIPGEYAGGIECIKDARVAIDADGYPHAVLPRSCRCGEGGCEASYELVSRGEVDWEFVEIPGLKGQGSFFVGLREPSRSKRGRWACVFYETPGDAGCYIWDGSYWSAYRLGGDVKVYPIANSHVPVALLAKNDEVRLTFWRDAGWGVWSRRITVYRSSGRIESVCGALRDSRGRLHVCVIESVNSESRLVYIHPRSF